jgi:hypothetical protein
MIPSNSVGIALRGDQGLAAAVRTAHEVALGRRAAGQFDDQQLGPSRNLADRGIGVVELGLLVLGEAGIRGIGGLVAAVGGDHGEALGQGRRLTIARRSGLDPSAVITTPFMPPPP